jgi:5-methylcytosine-specific restriction protein B
VGGFDMTLPDALSGIFRRKQKSYKMVLILSLLEEMGETPHDVSLSKVVERFQKLLADRERNNMSVDEPPAIVGKSWVNANIGQIRAVMVNPINALSKVIFVDSSQDKIGFRPEIVRQLTPEKIKELKAEALREMERYYSQENSGVSLRAFFSRVMENYSQAKTEPFKGHPIRKLMRQDLPAELKKLSFLKKDNYKIKGAVGQGNWVNVPWIAIMDTRITDTTRRGEYVVYLFSDDMRFLYLTLNQGVTVPLEQGRRQGYEYLIQKVREMRNLLPLENIMKDDRIYLTDSGIGRDYQVSTVGYIRYDRENMPDDETLISDLENMIENYSIYVHHQLGLNSLIGVKEEKSNEKAKFTFSLSETLKHIENFIKEQGFYFSPGMIENFFLSMKTKPFVILAGISGTGKTKLVQLFAEAIGATEENGQFILIPVRPDWNDPTDLLGYHDLSGVFKPGKLTQIFLEASQPENQDKPYFVCLDEMNLARVEHYFSDLLSVMETRRWEAGNILTDAIIDYEDIQDIYVQNPGLRRENISSALGIPQNVYIFGTVNMDETTHPFSKKVLDRAQTIEFNDIVLDYFPEIVSEKPPIQSLSPIQKVPNDFFVSEYLFLKDAYQENKNLIKRTTARLVEINDILEEVHLHVGFRVRDNICFYMIYNDRYQLLPEEEAFDFQLLQKILPRLQGSHSSLKRVLIELMAVAIGERLHTEELMEDASELYQYAKTGGDAPAARFRQSARKIAFMLRRLEEDGFTSFWLS